MSLLPEYWQPWPGPTGTTGPMFLGVTGAVTGPAFFGTTGVVGPTGLQPLHSHASYLYNRARVELVGAADNTIRAYFYDVCREFFHDSAAWFESIPGLLYPGATLYFIQPGQVQSTGDLDPPGIVDRLTSVVDLNTFPITADMPQPGVLRIQYPPTSPLSVFVNVLKLPARPDSDDLVAIPRWAVDTYGEYLLSGVKGKMMLQTKRPYSDPKEGRAQYQFFRQGVQIAATRAMRGNVFGAQAWTFPDTFRTNSQHGWVVTVGTSQRF